MNPRNISFRLEYMAALNDNKTMIAEQTKIWKYGLRKKHNIASLNVKLKVLTLSSFPPDSRGEDESCEFLLYVVSLQSLVQ